MELRNLPASDPCCPICGVPLETLFRARSGFTFCHCPSCTLVTSWPVPAAAELAEWYQGFQFHAVAERDIPREAAWTAEDCRRIVGDLRRIAGIAPPLDLLDWGGGCGFYASGFARQGCRVTLVDLDLEACRYAATRFPNQFEVIHADPARYDFDRQFQVIFSSHLVEHVPDLPGLMAAFRRALAPGGVLILATPNRDCKEYWFRWRWLLSYLRLADVGLAKAFSRFLATPWACCDPPRHLHAFNRRSLERLVRGEGFDCLAMFGEYLTHQCYHPRERIWVWRRLRSTVRIATQLPTLLGIELLRLAAPGGNLGNNLVLYASKPRESND